MMDPTSVDSADESTPLLHRATRPSTRPIETVAQSPNPSSSCATSSMSTPRRKQLLTRVRVQLRFLQPFVAAALIGIVTALAAYLVDVGAAVVADLKEGRCMRNVLLDRRRCCGGVWAQEGEGRRECAAWVPWAEGWAGAYGVYVGLAVIFAAVASGITATTAASAADLYEQNGMDARIDAEESEELIVNGVDPGDGEGGFDRVQPRNDGDEEAAPVPPKTIQGCRRLPRDHKMPAPVTYLSSGSGIPQLKSILAGFPMPQGFLSLRVLLAKAAGCIFAVGAGMSLGKEGPFVHISACVGGLVAQCFPRLRGDERRIRAMLSVACAAGIAVTFGAPIGGVLFSYEELSTHFPRRVLVLAFLCSLVASIALRELDPKGTGKLILFETHFSDSTVHSPLHYFVFLALGIGGGIAGGLFCWLIDRWTRLLPRFRRALSRVVRSSSIRGLRHLPALLEIVPIAATTAALQYPNRIVRPTGDVVMASLLVDCRKAENKDTWVCCQESPASSSSITHGFALASGALAKLFLTVITLTSPVPNGVIIPMLDVGALFGRLFGHAILPAVLPTSILDIPPGVCAIVGAVAFLAGVSRMTVCLVVLMAEMTGEIGLVPGLMVATLVSGWVAGLICREGVYEICGRALGCPVLDAQAQDVFEQAQPGSDATAED